MPAPAVTRRYDTINALAEEVRAYHADRPVPGVVWTVDFADRAALADRIRAVLAPFGRTDRWTAAVEGWAYAVETAKDAERFRWAFDQHGIYACHAAE